MKSMSNKKTMDWSKFEDSPRFTKVSEINKRILEIQEERSPLETKLEELEDEINTLSFEEDHLEEQIKEMIKKSPEEYHAYLYAKNKKQFKLNGKTFISNCYIAELSKNVPPSAFKKIKNVKDLEKIINDKARVIVSLKTIKANKVVFLDNKYLDYFLLKYGNKLIFKTKIEKLESFVSIYKSGQLVGFIARTRCPTR